MRNLGLSREINVIFAEKSSSKTNSSAKFFADWESLIPNCVGAVDAKRSNLIFTPKNGIEELKSFSANSTFNYFPIDYKFKKELEEVISWHDKFVSLPELDENWAWQVEFGLEPNMFYQFRPFKKIEKANFILTPELNGFNDNQ